jgi:hypothetical protein
LFQCELENKRCSRDAGCWDVLAKVCNVNWQCVRERLQRAAALEPGAGTKNPRLAASVPAAFSLLMQHRFELSSECGMAGASSTETLAAQGWHLRQDALAELQAELQCSEQEVLNAIADQDLRRVRLGAAVGAGAGCQHQ